MTPTLVTRWYLEHDGRAVPTTEPPLPGLRVEAVRPCSIELYRMLYGEVGRDWRWTDRLTWSDERLGAQLARDDVGIFVLYKDGVPGGFFELCGSAGGPIDIHYFGCSPRRSRRRRCVAPRA